jgi:hypothetical protein
VAFEVVTVEEVERAIPIPFIQGFKVVTAHEYNVAVRIPLTKTSAKIQVRRGLRANLPASASEGEPLFATDTGELFVGPSGGGAPKKFAEADAASGEATTTDGTITTLCSFALADDTAYQLEAWVSAISTGAAAVDGWHFLASAWRLGGGGANVSGSTVFPSGSPTYTAAIDASGNDVRLRVTGAAATTVKWAGRLVVRTRRAG